MCDNPAESATKAVNAFMTECNEVEPGKFNGDGDSSVSIPIDNAEILSWTSKEDAVNRFHAYITAEIE